MRMDLTSQHVGYISIFKGKRGEYRWGYKVSYRLLRKVGDDLIRRNLEIRGRSQVESLGDVVLDSKVRRMMQGEYNRCFHQIIDNLGPKILP